MKDWRNPELTQYFLAGVRAAIPLADAQLESISRLVKEFVPDLQNFIDLGCGDGVIGRYVHELYPEARGIYLDYSAPMISELKKKVRYDSRIISEDYSKDHWLTLIEDERPFDLILSGYSIHHLQHEDKKILYNRIYELLREGGLFLNLEHVASPSSRLEKIHDNIFIDALTGFSNGVKSREIVKTEYENRQDKILNVLAPVEEQCNWLRKTGFKQVDCYFKLFELALFGGVK